MYCADCLTSALAPLKPFCAAPGGDVTVEVAELCAEPQPFTSYINHLYVYPQSLAFDTQKMFTRARNIACAVQLRDSDAENAQPLTVINFFSSRDLIIFNPFWFQLSQVHKLSISRDEEGRIHLLVDKRQLRPIYFKYSIVFYCIELYCISVSNIL